MKARRASNTIAAYRVCWDVFERWCATAGRDSLPATPDTVGLFVVAELEGGRRLATVKLRLAAINQKHKAASLPLPVVTGGPVRELVQNAARERRERPRKKAALTPELLRKLCRRLESSGLRIDVRDRAMFLVGFGAGWRRSEISSLDLGDLEFERRGRGAVIRLGASKTDQTGKGRLVGLPPGEHPETCPVAALKEWLKVRGGWDGPLFTTFQKGSDEVEHHRVAGFTVYSRFILHLQRMGIDAGRYGAHSLRAGHVTAAAERGASLAQIAERTGHQSMKVLMDYIRPAELFRVNTMAGVL